MAKSRSRREREARRRAYRFGIVIIVLLLAGGVWAAVQSNRPTEAVSEKLYEQVSLQRATDIVRTADHSLVYFRSPT